MPLYPLTLLITSVINFFLAIFVFTQNVRLEVNQAFAYWGSCIAVWGFGMLIMTMAPNPETAMIGITILQTGLFFGFSSFFNFCLALLNDKRKINKRLCFLAYNLSFLFVILDCLGLIVSGVTVTFGYYQPVAGIASPFLQVTFLFYMSYGVFLLYQRLRTSSSALERDRIRYLFIGLFGVVVLSLTNILLVLGVRVYPTAHLALTGYALLTAYAIVRYRLMDISVIIKKTIVYSTLTAAFTACWLISILFFENIFKQYLGYKTIFPSMFMGCLTVFALQPVQLRLQGFIDRAFFRQRYDQGLILARFHESISSTIDKESLLDLTLKTVKELIPIKSASVMMPNDRKEFVTIGFINDYLKTGDELSRIRLKEEDLVVQYLRHEKRDLLKSELLYNPDLVYRYPYLIESMQRLEAELIIPLFFQDKLLGLLLFDQKRSEADFNQAEIDLLSLVAQDMTLTLYNIKLFDDKINNLLDTISALGMAIEAKDSFARGHCQQVERYSTAIGRRLGLKDMDIQALQIGSMLHDIGKIGVNEEILKKKGKLTEEEFEEVKKHSQIGTKIVSSMELPEDVISLIYSHHERLDGSGYPHGLKGEEISLLIRILGVVDTFVAMTSRRPYRDALSVQWAMDELKDGAGHLYDRVVVEALMGVVGEEK